MFSIVDLYIIVVTCFSVYMNWSWYQHCKNLNDAWAKKYNELNDHWADIARAINNGKEKNKK